MNTSNGPVAVERGPGAGHVINTSDILEPPKLEYLDEPAEIVHVLSGAGYAATFEDGHREDLVFWVVGAEGEVFGATLSDDGKVDLASAEDRKGFVRYEKTSDEEK